MLKILLKRSIRFLILFAIRPQPKGITLPGNLLVIAPHPDDEILGLGGTLLQAINNGSKVSILYLTDGEGSDVWHDKEEIRKQRIMLSEKACSEMGINLSHVFRLHLPDGNIPFRKDYLFEKTAGSVTGIINKVEPDVVFTTSVMEYWPDDHVAAAEIAQEAVRKSKIRPLLYYYWVWTWFNIGPKNITRLKSKKLRKVDIRDYYSKKALLKDIYLKSFTSNGKPWSGVLPEYFLQTLESNYEMIES